MDIRQLRHFAAVAQTLHFGRAADGLGMSQPPLSQSIMALERELGAALFVRTKRSVALTPFGAEWLTHVRSVLDGVNALPEIAKRLRDGTAGRLAISFVSTAAYSILPTLVRRYAGLFPDVGHPAIQRRLARPALLSATGERAADRGGAGKLDQGRASILLGGSAVAQGRGRRPAHPVSAAECAGLP